MVRATDAEQGVEAGAWGSRALEEYARYIGLGTYASEEPTGHMRVVYAPDLPAASGAAIEKETRSAAARGSTSTGER